MTTCGRMTNVMKLPMKWVEEGRKGVLGWASIWRSTSGVGALSLIGSMLRGGANRMAFPWPAGWLAGWHQRIRMGKMDYWIEVCLFSIDCILSVILC